MNGQRLSGNAARGAPSAGPDGKTGWLRSLPSRPWWPWAKRIAYIVFLGVVAALLTMQAREIRWDEVGSALARRSLPDLAGAVALATASYALYSCFDLLGRRYTGHGLGTRQVMTVNFISYAFNLNLGSVLGGIAFRYRLYSRLGLDVETVTRIVFVSVLTNWLGYVLLAGAAFAWRPMALPDDWVIGGAGLRIIGCVLLAAALAYLLACARARRRTWTVKGHALTLPSWRFALVQFAMSAANWMLIAGVMTMLLERKVPYPVVLEVLLMAVVAGLIIRVPAGLGVLEAVFVALLSDRVPQGELLAALLTSRAVYYLAPLLIAGLLYLVVEMQARRTDVSGQERLTKK